MDKGTQVYNSPKKQEDNKMSVEAKSPREILKDKVVALVKDFIKTEGGITIADIQKLFGDSPHCEIVTALLSLKVC
jgi:hypothetical protein